MKNTSMVVGRNITIDIAKSIGILLMIVGHCWEIPYMPYRHIIFTFHMPLFFIISGYFFKNKDVKVSLVNDAKHLLIPYFVTSLSIILILLIRAVFDDDYTQFIYYLKATFLGSGSKHPCIFFSNIPNIGALWFFPALYICKNVYNILPINKKIRLIYSFIIYMCAYLLGRYVLFIPFSVLSGLSAIIFYAIGDNLKECNRISKYYWIIGIICWILSFKYSRISLVQPIMDLYIIDIIGATTASILIYIISKKLTGLNYLSKFLFWVGKNSMYILCFHLIDLNIGISSLICNNNNVILSLLPFPLISTYLFEKIKTQIKNK